MNKYSFCDDEKSIYFILEQLSKNPNLTEWEKGFVKSLSFREADTLTEIQKKVLSNLWEKY